MRVHHIASPLLALTLVLAGCGDSGTDDPVADPTAPTATTSPTPSPSAAPVDLSVAPPGETAKQFIRRWVALSNEMQRTGDADAYFSIVSQACGSCRRFARRVQKIHESGGTYEGGDEIVVSLSEETPTQWIVVREAEPTEYAESAGAPIKTFPGGRYKSRVFLTRIEGRWIVGVTEGLPL